MSNNDPAITRRGAQRTWMFLIAAAIVVPVVVFYAAYQSLMTFLGRFFGVA